MYEPPKYFKQADMLTLWLLSTVILNLFSQIGSSEIKNSRKNDCINILFYTRDYNIIEQNMISTISTIF